MGRGEQFTFDSRSSKFIHTRLLVKYTQDSIKIVWDTTPCSLLDDYENFSRTSFLNLTGM